MKSIVHIESPKIPKNYKHDHSDAAGPNEDAAGPNEDTSDD